MKVKDLIDKLGNFDPDMDIILKHPDACNNPYAVVCKEIRLFMILMMTKFVLMDMINN